MKSDRVTSTQADQAEERRSMDKCDVKKVLSHYVDREKIFLIEEIKTGYINRTFKIGVESESGIKEFYTLQRINNNVFPDVEALMDNFIIVSEHLSKKLRLSGQREGQAGVQRIKLTNNRKSYYHDASGYWRMVTHFSDVCSMDIPDSRRTFYEAGKAFGSFLREMSDVPIDRIKTVIPNFHNTRSRYLDLERSVKEDRAGRVCEVGPELEFIRRYKNSFGTITDALSAGEIPTRVCHNDCNLNNILFDEATRLPVAIIDLDTTMPSSPLYDYGDSMRIGTNTAKDDEKDLSKVSCDLELYESYARGYLESCGDVLTKRELELLPIASLIITSEDGIRFLMDHVDGDTYYTIQYPGQNLDRSRTQLKLVEDMVKKLPRIKEILADIYHDLDLEADPFKVEF